MSLDYPDDASEARIIRLVREESGQSSGNHSEPIAQDAVFAVRAQIHQVTLAEPMERYQSCCRTTGPAK